MRTNLKWEIRRVASVKYQNGQSADYVDDVMDLTFLDMRAAADALDEFGRHDLADMFRTMATGS